MSSSIQGSGSIRPHQTNLIWDSQHAQVAARENFPSFSHITPTFWFHPSRLSEKNETKNETRFIRSLSLRLLKTKEKTQHEAHRMRPDNDVKLLGAVSDSKIMLECERCRLQRVWRFLAEDDSGAKTEPLLFHAPAEKHGHEFKLAGIYGVILMRGAEVGSGGPKSVVCSNLIQSGEDTSLLWLGDWEAAPLQIGLATSTRTLSRHWKENQLTHVYLPAIRLTGGNGNWGKKSFPTCAESRFGFTEMHLALMHFISHVSMIRETKLQTRRMFFSTASPPTVPRCALVPLRPAIVFGHNLGVSPLQPLKDPGFVYSCMSECLVIQLTVQNAKKKTKTKKKTGVFVRPLTTPPRWSICKHRGLFGSCVITWARICWIWSKTKRESLGYRCLAASLWR